MLRICLLFFLILFVLPTIAYGAEKDNLIERQKLICMYKQIDDLLGEPNDHLVMVILTNQCSQPSNDQNNIITRSLPRLTMFTYDAPDDSSGTTLEPNDILMLTHEQLHCFKSNFQEMITNQSDPVPVKFKSTCKTD